MKSLSSLSRDDTLFDRAFDARGAVDGETVRALATLSQTLFRDELVSTERLPGALGVCGLAQSDRTTWVKKSKCQTRRRTS